MIGYVGKTAKLGCSSYRKWSSSAVAPMLLAKRRTSRLSHETRTCLCLLRQYIFPFYEHLHGMWEILTGGYSKPAPGPDMMATLSYGISIDWIYVYILFRQDQWTELQRNIKVRRDDYYGEPAGKIRSRELHKLPRWKSANQPPRVPCSFVALLTETWLLRMARDAVCIM